jgi:hypothetical protein
LFLAVFLSQLTCNAKIIPRRDPLDGALDASVIVIVKQQSPGLFRVEEAFLGDIATGQSLALPGFQMVVADTSALVAGVDRVEPITENTRILIFLKPAADAPPGGRLNDEWAVAGFGNCYFWSHEPGKLESLRSMANDALVLRRSWQAARDLPDKRQRVEALWPYLWDHNGCCYSQTEAELQKTGPIAGDYIAEQLASITDWHRVSLLVGLGKYGSSRLHEALISKLKKQRAAWEELLRRRGGYATYMEVVDPPGWATSYHSRSEHSEVDEARDIHGILYYGLAGLAGFEDRADLPFIRESALWGVKYRFKQLGDAALQAFYKMPDQANVPVIQAIWDEFSKRPFKGNELQPYDVVRCLVSHRFPESIPLMAQFVNIGFEQEEAREFLVRMTGVDFGGDTKKWLGWCESHKGRMGGRR